MIARLLGAVLTAALLAAGCGGSDDGDLEVYCQLVNDGVGTETGEFDALAEVAPPEIRDAVTELGNTTRNFDEIEEIDELFDAAFDPDAQAARREFEEHAESVCDYEAPVEEEELRRSSLSIELREYVADNFSADEWPSKVTYRVEQVTDGQIFDVTATFLSEPQDDEPLDVCSALGAWLYSVIRGAGEVSVEFRGDVVAERLGRTAGCEVPEA